MNQVRQGFPKRFLAGLIDGVIMFVERLVKQLREPNFPQPHPIAAKLVTAPPSP